MPKRSGITVDLTGLERHFAKLATEVPRAIDRIMLGMQDEAEDVARALLNLQVYDTPPRGYERTRALWRSIYAIRIRAAPLVWDLVIGAVGGAGGRSYALYVERGTYAGRITLDQVMRDAKAVGRQLIHLEYGDPATGMEPRPFVIPTAVMVANALPERVLDAVRQAERVAQQVAKPN